MKKMIFTLVAMLVMAVQTTVAMSYEQARNEALFLTDKMAYELNLSDAQYEAAYEINLDYLMSVTGYDNVGGLCWERRNADLRYILYSWQWEAFCAASYFFRPLYWEAGYWHFGIYARYPRRDYFFFGRPHFYASYRGGHSWHMNGGHSYYEHHRDHFRPGHVSRDHHVGMRNGFDRGDYRGVHHGNSSTRVTAGERHNVGGHDNGNWRGGSRSHGGRDGYRDNSGSGRISGSHNSNDSGRTGGNHNSNSGSYNGGTHSSGSHSSNGGGYSGGGRSNSGSQSSGSGSYNGGGRSSSHSSSGSYSGGSRSGGSHSSASQSRSSAPTRSSGSSHSNGGSRGGGHRR